MKTRHENLFVSRLAACALLAAFAGPAVAQYVWLDEKGVKQYSDMPPPASVPANRILKQPGGSATANQPGRQEATGAPAANAAPTLAEQNAAFKKRQLEAAEKEKKAAEQARLAAEKAKNCDRNRDYLRTLESGERISQIDKNGERAFLTDEQHAAEMREARQAVADCGK